MKKFYVLFLAVAFSSFGVMAQKSAMTEAEKEAFDRQQYEMELSLMSDVQKATTKAMVQHGQTGNRGPFDLFVEIGNGVAGAGYSENKYPFYNYYENNKSQTLYLAGELVGVESITGLAFDYMQIASDPENDLQNFTINIKHVADNSLTAGDYYDMTGAVEVFSPGTYIPATAIGFDEIIDINDFVYNGTDNLIVEIIWGDNGEYTSTYYRNYKTDGGVTRTLYGYADSETPPGYDDASTHFSNIRFYYETGAPPPAVPLSNWAFALIGLFAVTLVFFKFRK